MLTAHRPESAVVIPGARPAITCDLTVVIVNYNVRSFLEQALDSVYRAGADLDLEVIVVDNDSVDGSVEMVRSRFPDVTLIANEQNLGFGKANNIGIRQSHGRYILVLNPDTIVQEDTFTTLIRFMEDHPDAGMVGCRILNPDGTFARESRRSFPTPDVAFYKVSGLSRLFPRSRRFGRYNLTYLPEDEVCEVDALSGSCMFVRHEAIYANGPGRLEADTERVPDGNGNGHPSKAVGAGVFDEDFFMYGEDLDWCFRFGAAGWKVYYTPDTQIVHFKGESTKKGEARYVRLFYGAMSRFVEKHFQDRYSRLFSTFLHIGIWAKATQSLLSQWIDRLRVPVFEFAVAMLCVSVVALIRSLPSTFSFPPIFYWAVAPAYAAITVACVAVAGGYRTRRRNRHEPVWQGVGIAFLIVTTATFFIKSIAFSRVVILFGFAAVFVALTVLRWVRRELRERRVGQRQAVIVGPAHAAERFKRLLMAHPSPPFEVVGYIEQEDASDSGLAGFNTIPRLGRADQIRDIVRLRHIDDIVFAAGHVSNQSIFGLMQELLDLPIRFKILQPRQTQVVGKAFVGDVALAAPLMDAEKAVNLPRGNVEHRFTDLAIAAIAFLVAPLAAVPMIAFDGSTERFRRLLRIAAGIPSIATGKRSLVGSDDGLNYLPPEQWRIRRGVIPLIPREDEARLSAEQRQSLYWRYAQSQSVGLDARIALSFIRSRTINGLV